MTDVTDSDKFENLNYRIDYWNQGMERKEDLLYNPLKLGRPKGREYFKFCFHADTHDLALEIIMWHLVNTFPEQNYGLLLYKDGKLIDGWTKAIKDDWDIGV